MEGQRVFPQPVIQRVERPKPRRRVRTLIIALLIVLGIALIAMVGLAVYVGWSLTHPGKKPLETTPESLQLEYRDVEFMSRKNDVLLKGWFLPAAAEDKGMTVVMAHGYRNNREQQDVPALQVAEPLVKAGYPVLMFDFRNSGESGGTLTSVGQFEKDDLLGAIDWVKQEHPGRIALVGFSMGATTALLAAAEEPDVAGVVVDSPFSHLRDYLEENLPVWSGLPDFPFTPLIMTIIPPLAGVDPDQVDALAAVDRIYPRPILFIHSVEDSKIPYTESEKLWSKHPDRFQFWKAETGDHMHVFRNYSDEYINKVLAFFEQL